MEMTKSATRLGAEFGLNGREMNSLLKEFGYLYGEPGAYGLTAKGAAFAKENHHSRGTGGSAQYNPSWEIRLWADETADALRADLQAGAARTVIEPAQIAIPHSIADQSVGLADDDADAAASRLTAVAVAVAAGVAVVLVVAPLVKPVWNDKVKPAALRFRDRWIDRSSEELTEPDGA